MPWPDHFSIIAPFYDRALPIKDARLLIDFANLPVSGAVLDAGGGTGRVSQAIREQASRVVVADMSLGMLQQTRTKNQLLPVQSITENLSFMDETFERVIMVDAMHHVINHQETANELWRVLKPGGRIVIEEPNIRKLGVKIIALLEKFLLMRSHFLSPESIQSLFGEPSVVSWIEEDGFNAWVIVEKQAKEKLE
ncbi:MAG: class I SAM-dependent methyltransferase [Anaerolineales bacterium]|nr:MAG: class I SAM-dependent methyltransferase [Anaerolineales bacterium]